MIYYVEDDTNIRDLTVYALKQAGFEAAGFAAAGEFFVACKRRLPELVLLDIMLPEVDGLEILHMLREDPATKHLPVMMLTAKGTEFDTVSGLDAGADDYLAKPFDLDELLARIEVQLRHRGRALASQPGGDVLCVGAWAIDRAARTLTVDGAEVPLTRTEFNIVELLAAHPRKVYTKQELFELAWGEPYAAEDSTVSVHVSNIRAKLKPTGTDGYVQTVWGLGFKLAVDEGA